MSLFSLVFSRASGGFWVLLGASGSLVGTLLESKYEQKVTKTPKWAYSVSCFLGLLGASGGLVGTLLERNAQKGKDKGKFGFPLEHQAQKCMIRYTASVNVGFILAPRAKTCFIWYTALANCCFILKPQAPKCIVWCEVLIHFSSSIEPELRKWQVRGLIWLTLAPPLGPYA